MKRLSLFTKPSKEATPKQPSLEDQMAELKPLLGDPKNLDAVRALLVGRTYLQTEHYCRDTFQTYYYVRIYAVQYWDDVSFLEGLDKWRIKAHRWCHDGFRNKPSNYKEMNHDDSESLPEFLRIRKPYDVNLPARQPTYRERLDTQRNKINSALS